jgi:hypothetical protein
LAMEPCQPPRGALCQCSLGRALSLLLWPPLCQLLTGYMRLGPCHHALKRRAQHSQGPAARLPRWPWRWGEASRALCCPMPMVSKHARAPCGSFQPVAWISAAVCSSNTSRFRGNASLTCSKWPKRVEHSIAAGLSTGWWSSLSSTLVAEASTATRRIALCLDQAG